MRPVNGDAVCAGRRPLCCRNRKSWMGAVRSCRCKDKHNLLSGQQSAAINFPPRLYRRSRFCRSLRGCRRVVLCLPSYRSRPASSHPHAPVAGLALFASALSCRSCRSSRPPRHHAFPYCRSCPLPWTVAGLPGQPEISGERCDFGLQGVVNADFFAIFAWRFVRAARYETKRRIVFSYVRNFDNFVCREKKLMLPLLCSVGGFFNLLHR